MELKNQIPVLIILFTLSSLPFSFSQTPLPPSLMDDPNTDPQLKEICKITPEPELCLQSYFVYTGDDHPDPSINNKAVLRKEIEVAKKMSWEFYTQAINHSSQNFGRNDEMYTLFDGCSRMFVLATHELIDAKEALLKLNDMNKVKSGINVAIDNYKTCDNSIGSVANAPKLEAERLYRMANICMALANSIH